jgi:hypothetical protein
VLGVALALIALRLGDPELGVAVAAAELQAEASAATLPTAMAAASG